ncbi:MAG: 5'/3'-nucleotidase SurE [Alphaproteobacteria bacterium]
MSVKKDLRILISNDDGINAPGIQVLEEIARTISSDVWVVAPAQEQSGAAHSLTLHYPLRPKELGPKRFSVDGTPTDCVLMAIKELISDKKPDLVLSGVNNSQNLADDVTYSGTVAAAMEGTLLGVPSIAFSQCVAQGDPIYWETALKYCPGLIRKLLENGWPKGVLINVNIPNVMPDKIKGISVTHQGLRPDYKSLLKALDPRGLPYYWVGPVLFGDVPEKDTDLEAIGHGKISVTPLHLDLTHYDTWKTLKQQME